MIWWGQSLSLVGSQAVQFALIWWLTVETRDARIVTLAAALGLLPQVILGPVIGVLVDRWNRKSILFLSDAGVAVASLLLAGIFAAGGARPWHVLGLLFLRALGGAFHGPTMLASTTLMVPKDELVRGQGLNQALQGVLTIVTPPLGAALVALLAMAHVMLIDVATALMAVVPLLFVRVPQPPKSVPSSVEVAGIRTEFVAGFRFLARRRGHLILVFMSASINLCLVPAFSLLPLLVHQDLGGGPAQLAWLSSSLGVGLLVGGVIMGCWGGGSSKIKTVLFGLAGLGLSVLLVGSVPATLPAVLGSILAVGLAAPFVNGPVQVILQTTVPHEMQGRVFSLIQSLAGLTAPVGLAIAGLSVGFLGLRGWYLAAGLTCLVMALGGSFSRDLSKIEENEVASRPSRAGTALSADDHGPAVDS